ncbi:MAG: LysR family transcriptional regulator [Pseudomonadota bacterium]
MDWDKLRVFHAVADAGSLTHAGDQLHLSQSAISRQIRGLEAQLQATLFHRHARGLLLTEQGEILYDATRAIAKRLTFAAARIRDAKDEVFGEMRVTTTAGFGTLWLVPRLHRLLDEHPNLSVDLILTEAVLDLPMREADIAIRLSPPNQADLIRRPLMDVAMRLYATQGYLDRHGVPESRDALVCHRLISYSADAPQPQEAIEWLRSLDAQTHRTHLRVNSYFGVLKAALNGLGIAALPDYITRDYPELVPVLDSEASAPITVYFVYPEELRHSQRILAFRDFVLREIETFNREPAPGATIAAQS